VISDLEAQILSIRATAQQRTAKQKKRQDIVDTLVTSTNASNNPNAGENGTALGRTKSGGQRKREYDQQMDDDDNDDGEYDGMELDEGNVDAVPGSWGGHSGGGGSRGGGVGRGGGKKRGRGK
jgi:hypothetical protein